MKGAILAMRWLAVGILGLAMAGVAPVARAEEPAGPVTRPQHGGRGPMIEHLRKALGTLNLTDQQKEQIDVILDKAERDAKNLREEMKNSQLTPEQRRERVMAIGKQVHQQLDAVLTDEQKTALREKMRAFRPGGPTSRPAGGGGMGERMRADLAKLNLTADQQQKVDALLAETKARLQKLREENPQDRQAAREQFRQVMEETRHKLDDILTPEQQKQLREMRQAERGGAGEHRRGPRQQPEKSE